MDSSYQIIKRVRANNGRDWVNFHEFNILPGKSGENHALLITARVQPGSASDLSGGIDRVVDYGFEEVDIDTGKTLFQWWAIDHIPFSDSFGARDAHGSFDF
jgi:hypothetical protein